MSELVIAVLTGALVIEPAWRKMKQVADKNATGKDPWRKGRL